MGQRLLYVREWLNDDEGHAFVEAKIWPGYDDGDLPCGELMWGDCSRSVTLDFSTSRRARKLTLAKLDRVQRVVNQFVDTLRDAIQKEDV